ncbi:uncharacterized protein [Narcine bancroftii]|uniref:uncharacterized protein n=1 Tax=Narcine bancroftii TaxID=1343680 RepID=UPI00383173BE
MDNTNAEEISLTIQQIKEGPKAKLRELCKQYGLPISGTRVYFQRVLCHKLGIDPKSIIVQRPTSRSNSHGDCCSVAGCRSRRGKDTHIRWFTVIRKKGSHTAAITKAIQLTRKGWTPTMYSRICGQHFSCGQLSFEPSSPDYIPHLHMDPGSKAATSCPNFWPKESPEEAMDLTNKGTVKSVHIAGPSYLDFTSPYQRMNSAARILQLQTTLEHPLSVAQDTGTKHIYFVKECDIQPWLFFHRKIKVNNQLLSSGDIVVVVTFNGSIKAGNVEDTIIGRTLNYPWAVQAEEVAEKETD